MPDRWFTSNSPNFYNQIDQEIEEITREKITKTKKLTTEEIEQWVDIFSKGGMKMGVS